MVAVLVWYDCLVAGTARDVRTVDELLSFILEGGQPKYLLFWGHQAPASGGVGKGCFSQWWPSAFSVDGQTYATAEHYMMTAKALLFGDTEAAAQIRTVSHPRTAKDLGRKVHGFDDERWADRRFDLVVTGNLAKFGQHQELKEYLLGTGDRVLVEASPYDRIWGTGLAADHEHGTSPEHWPGLNQLGFALMEVRHRLRSAVAYRVGR